MDVKQELARQAGKAEGKLATKLGAISYILPSSQHEVIALLDEGKNAVFFQKKY